MEVSTAATSGKSWTFDPDFSRLRGLLDTNLFATEEDLNNNTRDMTISLLTLDPLVGSAVESATMDEALLENLQNVPLLQSVVASAGPPVTVTTPPTDATVLDPMKISVVTQPIPEEHNIYFEIHDLEPMDNFQSLRSESEECKPEGFLMDDLGDCGAELGEVTPAETDHSNSNCTSSTSTLTFIEDGGIGQGEISPTQTPSLVPPDPFSEDEGGKQELKCKFCGFVCCSKSSLGIHERRHTGERPYACKYCGRLFNSAQCCKHHERLHTGDKPFECQYCGKKYAVSTRLKRHERVHTREEPYKCGEPGCGKTFRWFDAFRDHRNTHNGVPLYLCSVCGKSFTSYLKFYYHERGHFLKRERDRNREKAAAMQNPPSSGEQKKVKCQKSRSKKAKTSKET